MVAYEHYTGNPVCTNHNVVKRMTIDQPDLNNREYNEPYAIHNRENFTYLNMFKSFIKFIKIVTNIPEIDTENTGETHIDNAKDSFL